MFSAYRVFTILRPPRPRHPVLQALLTVLVVCAFLVLLAVGAAIGLVVLLLALIGRALGLTRPFAFHFGASPRGSSQPGPQAQAHAADDGVIDGEFRVVDKSLPHGPQG
ncbi:MAG: hypothetical protein JSR26_08285 [Proteobacteria bacterium]|nr:hypothetical protein [Pseudomonadota bacterium]